MAMPGASEPAADAAPAEAPADAEGGGQVQQADGSTTGSADDNIYDEFIMEQTVNWKGADNGHVHKVFPSVRFARLFLCLSRCWCWCWYWCCCR